MKRTEGDVSVPDLPRIISQVKVMASLVLVYRRRFTMDTFAGAYLAKYPKETHEKVSRIQPALNQVIDTILPGP